MDKIHKMHISYSLLFCLSAFGAFAQSAELFAGASQVDITPAAGYPHYRGRSTGTNDPLFAKALVLRQGDKSAALVICDLLWIERSLSSSVRLLIASQTGIPYSNIIIAGTHTHTGPAYHPNIVELTGTLRPPFDEVISPAKIDPYWDTLVSKITLSVVTAHKSMEKVRMEAGSGQADGISFNRRFIMKDGKVTTNPGKGNPEAITPSGPVDPEVGILLLRKFSANTPLTVLSVFGVHADTFGGTGFSADYPGYFASAVSSALGGGCIPIFGTGPCGDVNHVDVLGRGKSRLSTKEIGETLAEVVVKQIPNLKSVKSPFLAMRSQYVYADIQEYDAAELAWANDDKAKSLYSETSFLERRRRLKIRSLERIRRSEAIPPTVEKEGWKIPLEVQVIGIGSDLAIVGLPGEVFVELGLAIKKASPFRTTLIIELTNSHIAYVPTRKAFSQGSYETVNSRLAPGGGEMMVEAAISMLKTIKNDIK